MRSLTPETTGSRPFLLILCFLVSFVVTATGIRWLSPGPHVEFFTARLAAFAAQKDDCNLIFIGSSHYRSAIDPLLFDRLTTEAGRPTHSYNFSMMGIHLPEVLYVLERIRRLDPANLEWVVLEPRTRIHFRDVNKHHQRLIYYHDIPATLMALKCVYHREEPPGGRFSFYRMHLQQFGYRFTNQGLAQSLVTDLYRGKSPARTKFLQKVTAHQGYVPHMGQVFNPANRRFYEEDVREFAAEYERAPLDPGLAELQAQLLQEIEAMGARPIFLFAPVMDAPYELVLPADAPAVDVVRLDDVKRYPELFALENRWDANHLNHRGAQLTTAAAAEAFLRIATGEDGH